MKRYSVSMLVGVTTLSACSTMQQSTGPTPQEQFTAATHQCPMQLSPFAELSAYVTECESEGVNGKDSIAALNCTMPKLRSEKPGLVKEFPILAEVETIAKSVPASISPTALEYQAATRRIQKTLGDFVLERVNQSPYPMTKCYNQALLTYLAPTAPSPAAVDEYAATSEEIALKQQNGKISRDEASLQFRKAGAVLREKSEAAANQQRQAALIEAQTQAAQSQAAGARALILQQALSNYQQNVYSPPPTFRHTNCSAAGNSLNCTTF